MKKYIYLLYIIIFSSLYASSDHFCKRIYEVNNRKFETIYLEIKDSDELKIITIRPHQYLINRFEFAENNVNILFNANLIHELDSSIRPEFEVQLLECVENKNSDSLFYIEKGRDKESTIIKETFML